MLIVPTGFTLLLLQQKITKEEFHKILPYFVGEIPKSMQHTKIKVHSEGNQVSTPRQWRNYGSRGGGGGGVMTPIHTMVPPLAPHLIFYCAPFIAMPSSWLPQIKVCTPFAPPPNKDSVTPLLHDWCNKGRGVYYPVCGTMHIYIYM